MSRQIIECVPNISEGRDKEKIKQIAAVVESVAGVKLLNIDPGAATNRTVITFVGEPEPVIEAAFRLVKKAADLIDMSKHSGAHPRFGATDVCPLIPIAGIDLKELAGYAHKLGYRIGSELGIAGYFYESAATTEKRKNLAYVRSGEYEGLSKISQPEWKPDFGPAEFNDRIKQSGVIAVGARDFLVAYNVNLNSTSTRRANAIAFDIREAGRIKREGDTAGGKVVSDANGEPVRVPGTLKAVKGIGWYIEEYGIAQLSLNLTNIKITSVHQAFDEACRAAAARGIRVTGSEIVGLIPLQAILDAADYFLQKQQRSLGISEKEKIKIAVKSLGLDDLAPFIAEEKIIEYKMQESAASNALVDLSLTEFANATAADSPAPGGGSVAAYAGALGVSLGVMVANLSAHKRGWDDRWEEFSNHAVAGQKLQSQLLALVDEDTVAFNKIMDAFGLPKDSEEKKKVRKEAIQAATKHAIEVPMRTAQLCYEAMVIAKAMAETGNPNSVTDAAVGALCARAGVVGALLNVEVNAGGLDDKEFVKKVLAHAKDLKQKAMFLEGEILEITEGKI